MSEIVICGQWRDAVLVAPCLTRLPGGIRCGTPGGLGNARTRGVFAWLSGSLPIFVAAPVATKPTPCRDFQNDVERIDAGIETR